jgi:serine/threonine protein kinase
LSSYVIDIGDYNILKKLGQGSYGNVYKGQHKTTGELVAIKVLNGTCRKTSEQISFFREVESMAQARHPSILRFCGFNVQSQQMKDRPVMLTQFLPNGSLEDILEKQKELPPTRKMIILYGIADGMQYLHDGLGFVHRDLKPANVLLNELFEPVIGDFGLAKVMDQLAIRQTRSIGSPIYMAPELHMGVEYTDTVDVYAYAVMMCEILMGSFAFAEITSVPELTSKIIRGFRPKVSPGIPTAYKDLMDAGWCQAPDARPSFSVIVESFRCGHLNLPGADLTQFERYCQNLDIATQKMNE